MGSDQHLGVIGRLTILLALAGCDGGGILRPDSGPGFDTGREEPDAAAATQIPAGPVSGELCGLIAVLGTIEVPAGETLTVCAGSTLSMALDAAITVNGTLVLAGTDAAAIQLLGTAEGRWAGLAVNGTLEADFTNVYDARRAITGGPSSSIRFDDGLIHAFALLNLELANGGTFDRTLIRADDTLVVTGGMLSMTDSTIDLDHPGLSPDCVHFAGGGATLDHVRVANCHCPLHLQSTTMPFTLTASILEGASVPIMIASTSAEVHGNVIDGPVDFEDIGGGIDADVSGNYYGGGAPVVDTDTPAQFTGAGDYLTERPAGVGPRQ